MDTSFIPVEIVPTQTPFGLDQLRRSYKTPLTATAAIAAVPAVGTADETFPNMFLMPINTPESAESATRVDLIYMGCFAGASGTPTLPAQKSDTNTIVQSATSSKLSDGTILTGPGTLQYYAPQAVLTYFSFGVPGSITAPAPTASPVPITLTVEDTTFAPTGSIQAQIDQMFTLQIISTIDSTEIVPGKYWQNVARTSKLYSPWIFSVASGPYLSLYSPGGGYTATNTLTISGGSGSATIVVDSVGSVFGDGAGILDWHETSNTFTADETALPATGGSGHGAGFNVTII